MLGRAIPPAELPAVLAALEESRKQWEQMVAREPDLPERMARELKLGFALEYAEFFAQSGIFDETRERLLDLLTAETMAPNRGELGETEATAMRQLIGEEKHEKMRAYGRLAPGLRRADEIIAHLRDAKIEIGEAEAGLRELAAATGFATDEISRRVYLGTPIAQEEERLLVERARAKFEPLKQALGTSGDERARAALHDWIERRIARDLQFAKDVIALHARGQPRT